MFHFQNTPQSGHFATPGTVFSHCSQMGKTTSGFFGIKVFFNDLLPWIIGEAV
jgi:hypothetical protein